jgi:hypothetical protein
MMEEEREERDREEERRSRDNMVNWYRINKLRGGLGSKPIFGLKDHPRMWEKYIQKIVDSINKEGKVDG